MIRVLTGLDGDASCPPGPFASLVASVLDGSGEVEPLVQEGRHVAEELLAQAEVAAQSGADGEDEVAAAAAAGIHLDDALGRKQHDGIIALCNTVEETRSDGLAHQAAVLRLGAAVRDAAVGEFASASVGIGTAEALQVAEGGEADFEQAAFRLASAARRVAATCAEAARVREVQFVTARLVSTSEQMVNAALVVRERPESRDAAEQAAQVAKTYSAGVEAVHSAVSAIVVSAHSTCAACPNPL